MQAWAVYIGRLLIQRTGVKRPPKAFADKRIIVGITCLDAGGQLIEQLQIHGRVIAANGVEGIVLMRPDGGRFAVPPSPQWLKAAKPGKYRLHSTGEVVVDPDYLLSMTLGGSTPERVRALKAKGFEGPFG